MSSHLVFMGPDMMGLALSASPFSHQVVSEWDFALPQAARWYALQLQYELIFDDLGVPFTPGQDSRVTFAETLHPWSYNYDLDTAAAVGLCSTAGCPSVFQCSGFPHGPLGADATDATGVLPRCCKEPRQAGLELNANVSRGCTGHELPSIVHTSPHLVKFKVCFRHDGVRVLNSLCRQFTGLRVQRPVVPLHTLGGNSSDEAHGPAPAFDTETCGTGQDAVAVFEVSSLSPPQHAGLGAASQSPRVQALGPCTASVLAISGPCSGTQAGSEVSSQPLREQLDVATAALSQRVRPVASTAHDPQPCSATGVRASSMPGLVDLRARLASRVDLFPEELDRPEMRGRQISQFWWYTGFRASGSVGDLPQQDRFALFTTASHVEVRHMRRGITLEALVAEIYSVVPGLRSVRILLERIGGLPAVQIAATTRDAPPSGSATPVDLREVGGRICTVDLLPGVTTNMVTQEILSACPPARRPQVPFRLLLPDDRAFVAIPYQVPGPDFIKGHAQTEPTGEAPWNLEEEGIEEETLALLQVGTESNVIASKSMLAADACPLDDMVPVARGSGSCPIGLPVGDPPTLLKTEGPPRASVVHSTVKVPTILPERLAAPNLREIPAGQLCLFCQAAAHHNEMRRYSVFDRNRHHSVRKASVHWSLLDYIVDATGSASEETQSIQVLTLPIADLPEPQFTITPVGLPIGVLVIPIDARSIGGPLCALPLQPGSDYQRVLEALALTAPSTAQALEHLLQLNGVFLQDPTGRIWDALPMDLSEVQWLKVVLEPQLHQQLGWLTALDGSTTLTSTAVRTASQTSSSTETVSFVLAGGGTVIRLAPQPIRQASVRQSLCELLFIMGLQGRVPHKPVVSLASAAPRQAAQPANRFVIFLVYPAADIGGICHILQDYSLDGSLLQEMSVDCDVVAGHLISEAHRRRGYQASLNGIPHTASCRPLITGDLIQVEQAPQSARVTPIDAMFDILPDLRFFSMPIRVPALLQLMRDPAAGVGRQDVIKDAMQRSLDVRILERRVEVGEPGHNCQAILVLGPEHPPLLLYMPSNVAPSLAEATTYLAWSGFFEPGTTFVDPQVHAHTFPVFVSVPKGSQRATVLFPAPHTLLHWLQLHVPLGTPLQGFGLPVRRNFELVLPARTTHGAVIRERLIRGRAPSPETEGTSLLQVQVHLSRSRPEDADASPPAPSLEQAVASTIPTPLGRRHLPRAQSAVGCNSLCQGPTCAQPPCRATPHGMARNVPTPLGHRNLQITAAPCDVASRRVDKVVQNLELSALVPPPAPAITWEVNQEICDFCLTGHRLHEVACCPKALGHIPARILRLWRQIPHWDPGSPCEELFLFTDGSYTPANQKPTWAVVAIARQGVRLGRVGVAAGIAQGPHRCRANLNRPASAYDGELEAAMHGLAIAASNDCPTVHMGIDCASALQVIQGLSPTQEADKVARAAISLKALLAMQGKQIFLHKVLAHDNCALNDLADAAAKAIERGPMTAANDQSFKTFWLAIMEGVVDRLWLVPGCPLTATSMPPLRADGTWSRANCQVSRPAPIERPFGMQPDDSEPCAAELCFRMLQYNPLSLRGVGATELVEIGLRKHRIDIAGFQETRLATKGFSTVGAFWVLSAACTDKGIGGAQIWIRQCKHWDRQAFSIVHADPQILVVVGTYRGVRFQLTSAHAPPACSPEPVLLTWWSHLSTVLHRAPEGSVPLLFVDANATFARQQGVQETIDSRPACPNSKQLLQLAAHKGLYLSPQSLDTGEPLFSWTSPQGHRKLIDYIATPEHWSSALKMCPAPNLGDLHSDFDHQPVMAQLKARVNVTDGHKGNRIDSRIWRMPDSQVAAAAAACTCPPIRWDADSTSHVDVLQRHLHSYVSTQTAVATARPRNPALSMETLEMVRVHRHLRRCCRHAATLADKAFLQLCIQVWKNGCHIEPRLQKADRNARVAAARRWAWQYRYGKRMRRAMWRDKAAFTREGIQTARADGPSAFAHKLRAILRTGRRYRAPALMPCLADEPECPMTKEAVADSFGKYFAKAERARATPIVSLLQSSCHVKPAQGCLNGRNLPSLADLAAGFASLQKGRAPGISGLVPEVYRSNPLMLAIHYFPVVCKIFLRDPAPFQWRGGASACVPKPGKPPTQHQGYRAIMLFECDNKAIQKAMRPQLLKAMDALGVPDQMGGRPRHTLDMPSACVKAHLLALRRMKKNGAVIFIDSAAAYYSIVKDVLVLTPQQKADSQLLHKRAELLFDDLQLQAEFVNIVQSSAGELDAAMSTELQRFLQQQLDTTWYVSRNNASHAFVAGSGTAPGSPLADVMFSLVFGRVLKRTAAFLKGKGMQATIVAEAAQGHGFTPTWADDVSILLQTSSVESIVPAVADTISYFLDELRQAGLKANFGPGKTEALLSINGQGARKMRQQLFCQECPAISFRQHGEAGSIRVTATYEYLGSLIQADGHALPSILHRRTLAREMFRPVKNRMLRNPALTVGEKTGLLRSRILTRFFYGSGLWTVGTKREQEAIDETVYGFYRSAFRHVLAVSSQGYANEELAGALGLPLPRELLNVECVRTLTQLARGGFQQVLQELSYDATWWQSVLTAMHAIGLAKEDVSSLDDVLSAANLPTSEVRAKCRLYIQKGIKARWIPAADVKPRPACDTVQVIAASGSSLTWICTVCQCSFLSKKDLAVHEARKHGKRAPHVLCAIGTRCEVCSTEFWRQDRLSEHLRRQPRCLNVYMEGDISHDPAPVRKGLHAWKPSVLTHGPRPWWATLTPDGPG